MSHRVSISISGLTVGYGANPVLSGVSVEIAGGEFVGIVGPNGSGKTTLLRSVARALRPASGAVLIDEREVFSTPARELARIVGVVPQDTVPAFDFTAREIVLMGRSPHLGRLQSESAKDHAIAEQAMQQTGTLQFADRRFAALSGGERQRVVIARALAQEPRVILLDEPTSHLDINYQFEILNLIRRLNAERGITVLAVLHDLNLAAQFCGRLTMLADGAIHAVGKPTEVLTTENVKTVYGVDVWVRRHPTSGRPYIISGVDRLAAATADSSFDRSPRVHVVSGGGTGAPIFARLLRIGCEVTAGVLNIGDTDQEAADALGIHCVSVPPFTSIPEASKEENLLYMSESDVVIVSDMPYGAWNLPNLAAAAMAADDGKPVVLLRPETTRERDFTGGDALDIIESLMPRATSVANLDELLLAVERIASSDQ